MNHHQRRGQPQSGTRTALLIYPVLAPALVALIALLAGCSAPVVWRDRQGADLRRDDYECARDAQMTVPQYWPGLAILVGAPQRAIQREYQRCMETRGWTRAPQ